MGQAAARAQAHAHHRPDIVTRGSRRTAGLRPRVNFYLVKPFTPREFTEMLNTFNVYWLVLNEHPEIQRR